MRLAALAMLVFCLVGQGADADAARKKKPKKAKPPVEEPKPVEEPEPVEAPTPPPAPASQPTPPPAADPPAAAQVQAQEMSDVDVDGLRGEYEQVREKLFTSRATSATVGDALYSARLTIHLRWTTTRFFGLKRVSIRLDGANVFDDTRGAAGEDDAPRFEGFVAPGKHMITIRVEALSKDDERVLSTTESSFAVDVPADKATLIKARAGDGGDMGWSWKRSSRGSYKLHLDVEVSAKAAAK